MATGADTPDGLAWRKSSYSGGGGEGGGDCVELVARPDGTIAVRDSKNPHGATLTFTRHEIQAWLHGAKAGEFDDLTSTGASPAQP